MQNAILTEFDVPDVNGGGYSPNGYGSWSVGDAVTNNIYITTPKRIIDKVVTWEFGNYESEISVLWVRVNLMPHSSSCISNSIGTDKFH
jgi:hypothetical protein